MGKTARILVVDDEKGIREGCRRVLVAEGHQVETAENGEAGLKMAGTGGFDLLLIDVKMPAIGGIELVRRILEIDSAVVCVVITGYATLETAIEATKSGAYDFLPKPFTPDELVVKVNKGLDRRRLMLEARRLREERERSLLEISVEKGRLITVIDCMQDAVLVTNRDGLVVLHNPAALTMLHLDCKGPIGQPLERCSPFPELSELVASAFNATLEQAIVSQEIKDANGSKVLMANVAPVRDERGEILGLVTVVRDITELKRLDRMKSQFVAMVSHELRAPLAAVQSYLDVMLSGVAGDDPHKWQRMLERSKARIEALLVLIDDLLDVSTIESGRIARRIEWINLPNLLLDVVEIVRPKAEARSIVIDSALCGDALPVKADREDMVRLFTNLLTNAIKYNKDGGTVRLSAHAEGRYLRIDITDTGIGIPEESIPKLFDEFYRVKRLETREITGTGLGLSIVKRIVDAHHGYVEVESKLGKGSVFSVFLPAEKV